MPLAFPKLSFRNKKPKPDSSRSYTLPATQPTRAATSAPLPLPPKPPTPPPKEPTPPPSKQPTPPSKQPTPPPKEPTPPPKESTPLPKQPAPQTSYQVSQTVEISEPKLYDGKPLIVQDASQPPDLSKILNLGRSESTSVHTEWEEAVVHETVQPRSENSEERVIVRDIHHHEIRHRIQPIIDVRVLPTKHYVPGPDGELIEVSEEWVAARTNRANWLIAETVTRQTLPAPPLQLSQPSSNATTATRGDERHYIGDDGVPRTETTWIHPVRHDYTSHDAGETSPIHIPSKDHQSPPLRNGGVGKQGTQPMTADAMRQYQRDAEAMVAAARAAGAIKQFPGPQPQTSSPSQKVPARQTIPQKVPINPSVTAKNKAKAKNTSGQLTSRVRRWTGNKASAAPSKGVPRIEGSWDGAVGESPGTAAHRAALLAAVKPSK